MYKYKLCGLFSMEGWYYFLSVHNNPVIEFLAHQHIIHLEGYSPLTKDHSGYLEDPGIHLVKGIKNDYYKNVLRQTRIKDPWHVIL